MANTTIGWATTGDAILRTSDGGHAWQNVSPPGFGNARGATGFFLDSDHAWITGGYEKPLVVWRTTDGGAAWQRATLPTGDMRAQLDFVDRDLGWVLVYVNSPTHQQWIRVFANSDGGTTWKEVSHTGSVGKAAAPQPGSLPLYGAKPGIAFANARDGWATVDQVLPDAGEPILYATRDGGALWTPVKLPDLVVPLPPVQLFPQSPLVFGATVIVPVQVDSPPTSLAFFTSHDGGTTWHASGALLENGSSKGGLPVTVSFADAMYGWISNSHAFFATHDGGSSWSPLAPTGSAAMRDRLQQLDFISPEIGWALVGEGGGHTRILMTTDGGRSWTVVLR